MISFDEIYAFTKPIPGHYSEAELHELYKLVVDLPDYANIVEIGVLYGRSASVYFQVAKAGKPLQIHLVDPWVVSEGDTYKAFHAMIDNRFRSVPFTMDNQTSVGSHCNFRRTIQLLHVDGDHSPEGIDLDCRYWLPRVPTVRFAVFHDYAARNEDGSLLYPQIKETVDRHCHPNLWEPLGVHDSQAKFRRK